MTRRPWPEPAAVARFKWGDHAKSWGSRPTARNQPGKKNPIPGSVPYLVDRGAPELSGASLVRRDIISAAGRGAVGAVGGRGGEASRWRAGPIVYFPESKLDIDAVGRVVLGPGCIRVYKQGIALEYINQALD